MRRLALAAVSLAFLANACQPATMELTEEEKAEIADEVNALHAEFWDAWRATDFDRGMSYFYDSPDLAFAENGVLNYGYADMDAKYRPMFTSVASQEITMTDSRTTVLAPDVVCIMEAGTYTVTDTAGVTGPEQSFAYTWIWIRRDGEWKVHIGHQSSPPSELTEEQKAEIADATRQAATQLYASWVAQEDVDTYVSYHSDWAGVPWSDEESLDTFRSWLSGYWEANDWEIRERGVMEVLVLGPDAAAVKGTDVVAVTDTTGAVREFTQDWAYVLVREDGRWRILIARLYDHEPVM